MKKIIQSVIDKEKECAERLEVAKRESRLAVQIAEKKAKDLVEQVRSETERAVAEAIHQAEMQADREQAEVLKQASISFDSIPVEKQDALAREALTVLIEH